MFYNFYLKVFFPFYIPLHFLLPSILLPPHPLSTPQKGVLCSLLRVYKVWHIKLMEVQDPPSCFKTKKSNPPQGTGSKKPVHVLGINPGPADSGPTNCPQCLTFLGQLDLNICSLCIWKINKNRIIYNKQLTDERSFINLC